MNILAIETSSPMISVAVTAGGRLRSEISQTGNASTLLAEGIQKVLKDAGVKLREIDAFAIGEGPGSYNGLRCGFATLHGILFSNRKPVAQINSLFTVPLERDKRPCGVILNARKNMFFYQKFTTELPVPISYQEGMVSDLESIPDIHSKDLTWYSYDVAGFKHSYPSASALAPIATEFLQSSSFEATLREPRYLRSPV